MFGEENVHTLWPKVYPPRNLSLIIKEKLCIKKIITALKPEIAKYFGNNFNIKHKVSK